MDAAPFDIDLAEQRDSVLGIMVVYVGVTIHTRIVDVAFQRDRIGGIL